jgi:hypothetical protein
LPDASRTDAGSLSARAQEILRRADLQMASLRAPQPPDEPAAPVPEQAEPSPPAEPRPVGPQDLGQLIDTVAAGISAARAHLVALSASLDRIAEELDVAAPAVDGPEPEPTSVPPALAGHATLPSDFIQPEPQHEAEPPAPAEPERPVQHRRSDAAHGAARLVAIEMAVAGDTREGVRRRLVQEFGIRDPSGILDDAFGPDPGPAGRRTYGA